MFEFKAPTKRDWALVAVLMIVVPSVLGFGVHWLTAEPAILIEWSAYFGARRPGELNHC
jgi:hypothetical protein